MKLPATVFALTTLCAPQAQGAERIQVQSGSSPKAQPASSSCVRAPGGEGADIECTLNLAPTQGGGAEPPARIVIRPRWEPACAARGAQVVSLGGPAPTARDLPTVDQAATRPACAS